jgi:hypothetical protein
VNLPVQHLSDEAVAAFAAGMLATPAHNRAARHIAVCAECAAEVAEQQAAVSALRSAPLPALPAGLLDRLRAVPVTTPLTPSTMALAPDGSAVFPAFGTVAATPARVGRPMWSAAVVASSAPAPAEVSGVPTGPPIHRREFHLPVAVPHVGRRTQQFALVAVAAAMITVGVAASASADTTGTGPSSQQAPAGGNQPAVSNPVRQVGYSTDRGDQLVTAVSGKRH